MKKITYFVLLAFIWVLLVSCSNKTGLEEEHVIRKREVSSKIDMNLVNGIVGNWIGDPDASYPEYGKRIIVEENGYIIFGDEKLQITDTKDNVVLTQTNEEKPFFYDFELNGDKLRVNPWYPVPKGMTGGSLKPMEYTRDTGRIIDISEIYGEWQSVDEKEAYSVSIKEESSGLIKIVDNLENKDSQILKIEEILENEITALSRDSKIRYTFIFSENQMTLSFVENTDLIADKTVEERRIKLTKIIN